jgi:tetratricopeptide (TPR) repeat protein
MKEIASVSREQEIKLFSTMVNNHPNDAVSHGNLAHILFKYSNYKEAVACCKKAIELEPRNPIYYNNLAYMLIKQSLHEEAIEWLKKGLQFNPNDAEHYNNLGTALLHICKHTEAIEAILQAIKINPKNDMYYSNIAIAFAKQERYEEAAVNYTKAIELNPKYATHHNSLGLTLVQLDKYEEAIKCFETAYSINPRNMTYRDNIVIAKGYFNKQNACDEADQEEDDPLHSGKIKRNKEKIDEINVSGEGEQQETIIEPVEKLDPEYWSKTLSVKDFIDNTANYLLKVGGFKLLSTFLSHKDNIVKHIVENMPVNCDIDYNSPHDSRLLSGEDSIYSGDSSD